WESRLRSSYSHLCCRHGRSSRDGCLSFRFRRYDRPTRRRPLSSESMDSSCRENYFSEVIAAPVFIPSTSLRCTLVTLRSTLDYLLTIMSRKLCRRVV